jgi:hypothetical protein
MDTSKRPGSLTFMLVGLVLLMTVAGLFVPFVRCPQCWEVYELALRVAQERPELEADLRRELSRIYCERCKGARRISPVRFLLGHRHSTLNVQ